MSVVELSSSRRVERKAQALTVLDTIPFPTLAINAENDVVFANAAAQDLFLTSITMLERAHLQTLIVESSPVFDVVARARAEMTAVSEREITLGSPHNASAIVDVTVSPSDEGDTLVLMFRPRDRARAISEREQSGATRSVAGMARTLAHEIKNPLAGIKGAAQLLKRSAAHEEIPLAQLIVDETDRIARLIDRMESIGDAGPMARVPVNVHVVLDRVASLAQNSFAHAIPIQRRFDPSLPPVLGDEDQLIQALLNLLKNAAEAVAKRRDDRGEITLATAFRPGVRIRAATGVWVTLPLEISVIDNGPGVQDDLKNHLFEPFISSKSDGGGLGLPVVAKIISAHGGVIEFTSEPGRTMFRILLPLNSGTQKL